MQKSVGCDILSQKYKGTTITFLLDISEDPQHTREILTNVVLQMKV